MKKLTLTVAILLTGTYLFAQSNNSEIVQNNSFNNAKVDQVGNGHKSTINQLSTAAAQADENYADVKQRNRNGASTNESDIKHNGKGNTSTVDQAGDNSVQVYIGGRVGGGDVDAVVNNETYAKQLGTSNVGKQSVYGLGATNTYLDLQQRGSGNNSEQLGAWSRNSEGYVKQGDVVFFVPVNGVNNTAWQQIDGSNQYASIYQLGASNVANQWINNGNSNDNTSIISQVGDRNNARAITRGDFNDLNVTQLGDDNKFGGIPGLGSEWNNAAQQLGNNNEATFTQSGDDNEFQVRQNGDNNTITGLGLLASSAGASQYGDDNFAKISQTGTNHSSASRQRGDNNEIELSQTGNGHTSSIHQHVGLLGDGNDNRAFVTQSGNSQVSVVNQNGHNNLSNVVQGNQP